MKVITFLCLMCSTCVYGYALMISEVMSNPVGDDGGREWVEIYNESDNDIDVSSLSLSIKGGSAIPVTLVTGNSMLVSHQYAIIGSTVSSQTKFAQEYPAVTVPLFKASMSLVNTGVTSLEIRLGGVSVDTLSSYTAAKEGGTYAHINGVFSTGTPTPGEENKAPAVDVPSDTPVASSTTQIALPQSAPASPDIVMYTPFTKTVVAGASSHFSVKVTSRDGKALDNVMYLWSFGDGGQKTGSSTMYTYFYPGTYIAEVEATNGLVEGVARTTVRVLSPDISLSSIGYGKYGSYIEITNPNDYELDISLWRLTVDGAGFIFPKHTILGKGVTRFPGSALGFASTTVSSSTLIKLHFPTMEEVVRVAQQEEYILPNEIIKPVTTKNLTTASHRVTQPSAKKVQFPVTKQKVVTGTTTNNEKVLLSSTTSQKDTRLARWIKSVFSH